MSTALETRTVSGLYTNPAARDAEVAEAIGCIITGRPLPEHLRAPSYELERPATVEAGIKRILDGPVA